MTFLLLVTLAGFGTLEIPTANCAGALKSMSGAVLVKDGQRVPLRGMVTDVKCEAKK